MISNRKKYGNELKGLFININETIKKTIYILLKEKRLSSREIIDLILDIVIEIFEYKENEKKYFYND